MDGEKINSSKLFIILPVFNESQVICDVIDEIQKEGYKNIIAIDDGSSDETFKKISSLPNVIALRHKINRGKGAATKTGFEAAKMLGAKIVVTMDSDGQHNPKDIKNLTTSIINKECEVTLGTRLKNPKGMPFHKIVANKIGNAITWYLFGLWVTDSQSGFRAYSIKALGLIDIKADRYEYESEMIREIARNKLKYKEVEIEVRYTDYSMGKVQKQGFINGLKTLYKIIWNIIS